MTRIAWVCVVLAVSSVASADSKAWTAAKKTLPSGMQLIINLNVSALRGTQMFQTLWPAMVEKDKDLGDAFTAMKAACAFDPAQHIDSLVVAGADDSDDSGVFVLSLKMTQPEIEKCFAKAVKSGGTDIVIGKDGAFAKYTIGGKPSYARWVDKNTMVIAKNKGDKDFLAKMTAGGIAKDPALAGVKTDSAMWLVLDKATPVDQLGVTMSRGYLMADDKAGNVSMNAHLVLDSAATATASAKKAQAMLDGAKASGQIPQAVDWFVKSLTFNAIGSELVLSASGSEQNVVDFLKAASQ